jgi:DNA repair protein RadC
MKNLTVEENHFPWNRAALHGPAALSDRELLQNIIGGAGVDILDAAGSLAELARWPIEAIEKFKGVGRKRAAALASVFELHKRAVDTSGVMLNQPDNIFRLLQPECRLLNQEHFFVLCLNRKNRLLKKVTVTTGTASNCLVHPREVFAPAIIANASAIVVAHNHPSGDPAPSRADIQVTRQLREAAKVIGIDLLDHIVIGDRSNDPQGLGYYSFDDAGLI